MKKLEIADSTLAVIKKVGEALFMYAEGIFSLRILQVSRCFTGNSWLTCIL